MIPIDVDYKHRPKVLEHVDLYTFKRYFKKVCFDQSDFSFSAEHGQHLSHGLRLRKIPIIPSLNVTIPSYSDEREDKRRLYDCLIFVLFVPWIDPISEFRDFDADVFTRNCSPRIKRLIENINALTASKREAERLAKQRDLEDLNQPTESLESQIFDPSHETSSSPSLPMDICTNDTLCNDWVLEFSDSELDHSQLASESLIADPYLSEPVRLLNTYINQTGSQSLPKISLPNQNPPTLLGSQKIYSCWTQEHSHLKKQLKQDRSAKKPLTSTQSDLPPFTDKVRHLLSEDWKFSESSVLKTYLQSESSSLGDCPVETIAADFGLNKEQTAAVRLVGLHLRQYLDSRHEISEPLRLFISGQGGTGKTHVINALRHLFSMYDASHLLSCSAPTGVAAFNINAPTTNSLFHFGISPNTSKMSLGLIETVRQEINTYRFFLIDEVSMVSQKLMYNIHTLLQKVHGNNKLFGGMHIIVLGDFLQLAPVSATPLYVTPRVHFPGLWTPSTIWNAFDTHIKLITQVRASTCPKLQDILHDCRNRSLSSSTYRDLENRLLKNNPELDLLAPEWLNAPIIVKRNELRNHLNILKHRAHCIATGVTEYVISSIDLCNGSPLQHDLKRRLLYEETHTTPGTMKSRICTKNNPSKTLHLSKGAKVMLTRNINTEMGLVNGALGSVYDILIRPGNEPQTSNNAPNCQFITGGVVVLFKPDKSHPILSSHKFTGLDQYPPGIVPIFPCAKTMKFRYPAGDGSDDLIIIERLQLDIELAYSMTDYKCQGRTFDNAIVDLTLPPSGPTDKNSNYVIVSRLTSLKGLLIIRPFPKHSFESPLSSHLSHQIQKELRSDFLSGT
jgi:hypothetical protein